MHARWACADTKAATSGHRSSSTQSPEPNPTAARTSPSSSKYSRRWSAVEGENRTAVTPYRARAWVTADNASTSGDTVTVMGFSGHWWWRGADRTVTCPPIALSPGRTATFTADPTGPGDFGPMRSGDTAVCGPHAQKKDPGVSPGVK
jgi:hypothetical protein